MNAWMKHIDRDNSRQTRRGSPRSLGWGSVQGLRWLGFLLVLGLENGVSVERTFGQGAAAELHQLAPKDAAGLQQLLRFDGEALPLVSAHRGGAQAGFPENCLATFEHTLQKTFAMLEVDPRRTQDGAFVLHHDTTLDRTTTGTGRLADYTLAELKALRLKDNEGVATQYQMPTLEEAFEWARGKCILVLDQKDMTLDERIAVIKKHRAESYCLLIISSLKDAQQVFASSPLIMMEFMIPTREKFHDFETSGIPWANIVAFVGHSPPEDLQLLEMLHAKGVCCMAGTSRNLDRELLERRQTDFSKLLPHYQQLLTNGVDLIETDIPRQVGSHLFDRVLPPAGKAEFFRMSGS